jgi:ankyrin repeat protein
MPNFYYTDANGQKQGLINDEQLKALVARKIITPDTLLETDTGKKGKAGQIKGLFPDAPPPVTQTVLAKASTLFAVEDKRFFLIVGTAVGLLICVIGFVVFSPASRYVASDPAPFFVEHVADQVPNVPNADNPFEEPMVGLNAHNPFEDPVVFRQPQRPQPVATERTNRVQPAPQAQQPSAPQQRPVSVAPTANRVSFTATEQATIDEFVRENGNDVTKADFRGDTLLHEAAANRNVTVVKYLVSIGADVNVRNSNGGTPLHRAAWNDSNVEVLRYLVSQGADINIRNRDGRTPLDIARNNGHTEMVQFLESVQVSSAGSQSFRSSFSNIFEATRHGTVQDVEYFLKNGVDVNINTGQRCTPLHIAARYNRLENAKYLVSQGADVHAINGRNATPRDDAVSAGHTEMVAYLDSVIAGADNPFAD